MQACKGVSPTCKQATPQFIWTIQCCVSFLVCLHIGGSNPVFKCATRSSVIKVQDGGRGGGVGGEVEGRVGGGEVEGSVW